MGLVLLAARRKQRTVLSTAAVWSQYKTKVPGLGIQLQYLHRLNELLDLAQTTNIVRPLRKVGQTEEFVRIHAKMSVHASITVQVRFVC